MKLKTVILCIVVAIFSGIAASYLNNNQSQSIQEQETVFERVMRTNVLRCGYWEWPPLTSKNQKTGEMSGVFYEYVNRLGELLNFEVQWVKDTGFTDFVLDLQHDRIDAMCAGVWPVAPRPRAMDFTDPIFYIPLNIYVRADDNRFDYNVEKLNDPQYTFSSMDGLVEATIVGEKFPQASRIRLTENNTVPELFVNVATGKADATMNDIFTAHNYMVNNPGKLKQLPLERPVMFFGNTIAVKKGEGELMRMLDVATDQLHHSGFIEELVQKYENTPGALLRVKTPYQKID